MSNRRAARRHHGRNRMVVRPPRELDYSEAPPQPPGYDVDGTIRYWREHLDKPLFVYFIQAGDEGPVKVGQAFDPRKRMAELQCGNHEWLNLRAVVLASDDLEESIHIMWASAGVRGEWFGCGLQEALIRLGTACQARQFVAHSRGVMSIVDIANVLPKQIIAYPHLARAAA